MSTFELTQKFANVASPNVLPGKDIFCMDMRILPMYSVDEVMTSIHRLMERYEKDFPGIHMDVEFLTRTDAPEPTSPESKVARSLYSGGIGGGTCGAILRARKIPAVVWATLDDTCHSPNEYVIIDNMIRDTQIYLSVLDKYNGA